MICPALSNPSLETFHRPGEKDVYALGSRTDAVTHRLFPFVASIPGLHSSPPLGDGSCFPGEVCGCFCRVWLESALRLRQNKDVGPLRLLCKLQYCTYSTVSTLHTTLHRHCFMEQRMDSPLPLLCSTFALEARIVLYA